MGRVKLQNWKGAITYYANSVEGVESRDDIVRIVRDHERYPQTLRAYYRFYTDYFRRLLE